MVRGLVAKTVDGNLRMRAPGFRSSASPLLGVTLRAQYPQQSHASFNDGDTSCEMHH